MNGAATRPASALHWLWLAALVVALDQASKWLVLQQLELYEIRPLLPVLDLTRLHNTGAAFSLLAGAGGWQRWFFVGIAGVVSLGIVWWLRRLPARGQWALACGLALVLGGALGNVIDRLAHGYVVDFLHFHWQQWYYPAFNIADSAITCGAALLILDALWEGQRRNVTRP